ncbi:hypothetical protein FKM82_019197 [Ascaphus truei]
MPGSTPAGTSLDRVLPRFLHAPPLHFGRILAPLPDPEPGSCYAPLLPRTPAYLTLNSRGVGEAGKAGRARDCDITVRRNKPRHHASRTHPAMREV